MVTIIIPVIIALGIVFRGFLTSLAGRVPISNPTYAQKINTNETPKFPNPSGANGR